MKPSRPFDKSEKAYELIRKEYDFDVHTRAVVSVSPWKHLRYYETMKGLKDAIIAARASRHASYTHDEKLLRITRYRGWKR